MGVALDAPARPLSAASAAVHGRAASRPVDDSQPPLVSVVTGLMGGAVGVHVRPLDGRMAAAADARRAAGSAVRRMGAWADRLTRFTTTSDLARLNASPAARVPVRPTLAATLDWARQAQDLSDGIVDVALLDARLAAEDTGYRAFGAPPIDRTWSMDRGRRGSHIRRPPGLRFDLDGVAKGWLGDRALDRLERFPAAVVDADGDIAIRLGHGQRWRLGVTDPRSTGDDLVVLELVGSDRHGGRRFGLATSGTSIHRWLHDGRVAHHLIDPRTGTPARTDVVQATVLAGTAREAEALAKTAVILGSDVALDALDRPGVEGAILLTDRDELLLTPTTMRWLG
jgi:thiamine biosynthesis lipoprotein